MLPDGIAAHYAPYTYSDAVQESLEVDSVHDYDSEESFIEDYDGQSASEDSDYEPDELNELDEVDEYDEYDEDLEDLEDEEGYVGIMPTSQTHNLFYIYNASAMPRHRLYTQNNVLITPITFNYHVTNLRNTTLDFTHIHCLDEGNVGAHDVPVYRHSWNVVFPPVNGVSATAYGEGNVTNFFNGGWPSHGGVYGPEGLYDLELFGHFVEDRGHQLSFVRVVMQRTSSFVDIEGNTSSTLVNPARQPDTVTVGRPDGYNAEGRGEADTYGNYRYFWTITNVLTNEVVQNGHSLNASTSIDEQGERGEYSVAHGPRDIDVSQFPPGVFRVDVTVREIVREGWPGDNTIYHSSYGYFEIIRPPSITKSANRDVISVGGTITYTITVNNPNHIDLEGEFVVIDRLHSSFVSFIPGSVRITHGNTELEGATYAFDGPTRELRVTLEPLLRGNTVITFRVDVLRPASGQLIPNYAVLQTPGDDDDLKSDEIRVPVPEIRKTSNRETSIVGDEITYTITVTNPSPTAINEPFAVMDYMNVNMVRFMPETLTMTGAPSPLPPSMFEFNAESGVLRIEINPLLSGNTVITYRVEVLEGAAGQDVNNVAVLEVPGDGENPRDEEDVYVPELVYRHLRIYYYLRESADEVNRDIVHNEDGRDYFRRIGTTFSTGHVLDRNVQYNQPGDNDYIFEGWRVIIGDVFYGWYEYVDILEDDGSYLPDKVMSTRPGTFLVPPPGGGSPASPLAATEIIVANELLTGELVGETISLIVIWSIRSEGDGGPGGGQGGDDDDKDDDDRKLPQTGIESYTETWATLLLICLLVMTRVIVALAKKKDKDFFKEVATR